MDDQSLRPIIEKLENVFSKLNSRFFDGELKKPVITVASDAKGKCLGWCTAYKAWHENENLNEKLFKNATPDEIKAMYDKGFYEINIVAEHLSRPFKEIVETLLHEMIHLYNLQHDIKDTSRSGTYHNTKFRDACVGHGLVASKDARYGYCITKLDEEGEKFVATLGNQDFGICRTFPIIFGNGEKGQTAVMSEPKQRVRKYVCPFCGISVRATKSVNILCGDCNKKMELEVRKKIS